MQHRRFGVARALCIATVVAVAGLLGGGAVHPAAAARIPTTTTLTPSSDEVDQYEELTLAFAVAPVDPPSGAPVIGGSVTLFDEIDGAVHEIPVGALDDLAEWNYRTSDLAAGTHAIHAVYAGDTSYAGSSSEVVLVYVIADEVLASDFAINTGLFFPVHDGYRDTVVVGGFRHQEISVAIAVKTAAGKTVRTASLPPAVDTYQWTWNGRSNSGKLVAAGKYRIVVTLRNANGTRLTVTRSVTVSLKRLVWKTWAATKSLQQRSMTSGDGHYYGWMFKAPSAYSYGTLTVSFYGRGYLNTALFPRVAGCAGGAWKWSCYQEPLVPTTRVQWYSMSIDGRSHISASRAIYLQALTSGRMGIQKVRVTLRYRVFK